MGIYYSPNKIAAARRNIEAYDWARQVRNHAVECADTYLGLGLDRLWGSITGQSLPRSHAVNYTLGSPITGKELIRKYGMYGWQADPMNEPWKLVDPSSGYQFPTNNFKSYYESGMNVKGMFDPHLADKSLLVNVLYPEKGERWGVDDGFGWIDDNGAKWTFVAYYNHWQVWHGGIVDTALKSFRDAFLYTGDLRYAQAGIVLLDRIADVYPEMDVGAYKLSDGYYHSNGGTGKGKVRGSIWETGAVFNYLAAYDAFLPALEEADAAPFLHAKASGCGLLNPKRTAADIRKNVEDGIVRQVYPAVKAAQIHGNFPMHQRALAMAAVVLGEPEAAKEWIEFVMQAGGLESKPDWHVTGGNVLPTLVGMVDRDGFGNEASPQYNSYWLRQIEEIADILLQYDGELRADLYRNVKFKQMYRTRYPLFMIGKYTPAIGDMYRQQTMDIIWSSVSPYMIGNAREHVSAFEKYGDPIFAQVAYYLNGNKTDGLNSGIFSDSEATVQRIRETIDRFGTFKPESVHLTGYGFAALRDGVSENERDLWLYYGRNPVHGHKDTLNIGLYAFGHDLTPDLGYPERTGPDPNRMEWVNHTVSHNTVLVDKTVQSKQWVGIPHHYDGTSRVKLIDVEAPEVYPQTRMYRRTVAWISADETNSYAVDIFRVKGGSEHHYSFHGGEGTASTEGLNLIVQPTGTYAGPDVPYGKREPDRPGGWEYAGSGFHYLTDVRRDVNPPACFSVDWSMQEDVHLRLTMVGEVDEAALAEGVPPQLPGNPERLTYLLARRQGEQLESRFVAVLEPYRNSRFVESIQSVELEADGEQVSGQDAVALKIILSDGRVDYIVNAIDANIRYRIDGKFEFSGFFGVYSERNGEPVYAYVHEGTFIGSGERPLIRTGQGAVNGTVLDYTRELQFDNQLIVQVEGPDTSGNVWIGSMIFVENDRVRNAVYAIKAVKRLGERTYALDIGESTLIRSYADSRDFSKGYTYDVASGQRFSIPLHDESTNIQHKD